MRKRYLSCECMYGRGGGFGRVEEGGGGLVMIGGEREEPMRQQ